jgi:hypothetical protein
LVKSPPSSSQMTANGRPAETRAGRDRLGETVAARVDL